MEFPNSTLVVESVTSLAGDESRKEHPRRSLPLKDRLEVIRLSATRRYSSRKLAEMFKCGRTQIVSTLRDRLKYIDLARMPGSIYRKRLNPTSLRYGELNEQMQLWVNGILEANPRFALTGPILQSKAREMAEEMGLGVFQASNGWLESFKKRLVTIHPETPQPPTSSSSEYEVVDLDQEQEFSPTDPLAFDYESVDEEEYNGSGVDTIPEIVVNEQNFANWDASQSSSSSTTQNNPVLPETMHLISLTQALRHFEDLKYLADALGNERMLEALTEQELVIKNLVDSRKQSAGDIKLLRS